MAVAAQAERHARAHRAPECFPAGRDGHPVQPVRAAAGHRHLFFNLAFYASFSQPPPPLPLSPACRCCSAADSCAPWLELAAGSGNSSAAFMDACDMDNTVCDAEGNLVSLNLAGFGLSCDLAQLDFSNFTQLQYLYLDSNDLTVRFVNFKLTTSMLDRSVVFLSVRSCADGWAACRATSVPLPPSWPPRSRCSRSWTSRATRASTARSMPPALPASAQWSRCAVGGQWSRR